MWTVRLKNQIWEGIYFKLDSPAVCTQPKYLFLKVLHTACQQNRRMEKENSSEAFFISTLLPHNWNPVKQSRDICCPKDDPPDPPAPAPNTTPIKTVDKLGISLAWAPLNLLLSALPASDTPTALRLPPPSWLFSLVCPPLLAWRLCCWQQTFGEGTGGGGAGGWVGEEEEDKTRLYPSQPTDEGRGGGWWKFFFFFALLNEVGVVCLSLTYVFYFGIFGHWSPFARTSDKLARFLLSSRDFFSSFVVFYIELQTLGRNKYWFIQTKY